MLPKIVARPWQVPLFRIFYRFITLLQYETDLYTYCKITNKLPSSFLPDKSHPNRNINIKHVRCLFGHGAANSHLFKKQPPF